SGIARSGLALLSIGAVDYAFANAYGGASPVARLFINGANSGSMNLNALNMNFLGGTIFSQADGGLGALYAQRVSPELMITRDITYVLFPDAGATITTAWRDAGLGPQIAFLGELAYFESSGSEFGRGFGMATTADGGLAGPVPNPLDPGAWWVLRPPVSAGVALDGVSCADPTFCVAFIKALPPNN